MPDVADVRNRLIIQQTLQKIGHHSEFLTGKRLDDMRYRLEEGEREMRVAIQTVVAKHLGDRA